MASSDGGRRRLGDLVGDEAVGGSIDVIEHVVQRTGQGVNVLAVKGRYEGRIQFDEKGVGDVVALVLGSLDFLQHPAETSW